MMPGGSRHNSVLTLHDIQTLILSHGVDAALNDTSLLHEVDLRQLTTSEQKQCFYSNLLNLMILHAFTVCSTAQLLQVSFFHICRPRGNNKHNNYYYAFIAYCSHKSSWIYKPREN